MICAGIDSPKGFTMSLFSLPLIAEQAFTDYLSANFSGTYPKTIPDSADTVENSYSFVRYFSTDSLSYPAIIVQVGQLKEIEPATHVYRANLSIGIISQIDDTADPIATHASAVGQIYDLLADSAGMTASLNARDDFRLWQIFSTNYDQDISRGDRDIKTILEYAIDIQTLPE